MTKSRFPITDKYRRFLDSTRFSPTIFCIKLFHCTAIVVPISSSLLHHSILVNSKLVSKSGEQRSRRVTEYFHTSFPHGGQHIGGKSFCCTSRRFILQSRGTWSDQMSRFGVAAECFFRKRLQRTLQIEEDRR